jgi:ribonucleoside-diphosphate reductase alpha subunit
MSASSASNELCVLKRNGKREEIAFDKILNRVKKLGNKEPPLQVQYSQLVMKVIDQIYDNINTSKIDELTAEQCASLCTKHLDYGELASRIIISNNHKNTLPSFYKSMKILYEAKDIHGNQTPLLHKDTWRVIQDNKKELDEMIDYERDFLIDYFGFKTLERAYLMRVDKKVIERIQHMWLRVSVGIHGDNMKAVKETYDLMSQKYFTHATPTLYNSGTPRPQLSSCYLLGMESDSIDGIYNTLKECATISKWAGGIGLHMHNIRSTGSHIRGTNGTSNGIVPMLRVFNMTARYVDQGGGKRNGSIAIYMEPHHADICDFLDLKKNHGDEEMRARDLFYALWISDLFMEKVKKDEMWSLFCPDACPGMSDVYGDKFRELYDKYTSEGRAVRTVKARELWFKILDSQMETGTPYLLYKDPANEKSNQKNLGTIKSSNLCTEIIEYSDGEQTAVCNLASLSLTKFVSFSNQGVSVSNQGVSVSVGTPPTFNYDELHRVTKVVTANLNRIIDVNFYPTEKTRLSNLLHRPIGIGVQGLADVFALMDIPYHSDEAIEVNKLIFETIYHASLESSNELAKQRMEGMNELRNFSPLFTDEKNRTCRTYKDAKAKPLANVLLPIPPEMSAQLSGDLAGSYSSFVNSPASKGILQFDMWGVKPSERYDWTALKDNIMKYGLRNSLLVAPMPTASTSQILGNNECFEPFTSNIYSRRTLAGDYVIINKYLMKELIDLGIWNEKIKDNIILNKGSIQHLEMIPKKVRDKYKIVWEIPMRHMIDMAADRGAYICQSQSLNLWVEDPDYKILTNMHFYSWGKGLKTGIYYLRRKPKHQPQQFTIGPSVGNNSNNNTHENEEETCETCSA